MNTALLSKVTRFVIISTSIAFALPAAAFTWQDDPQSRLDTDGQTQEIINGNVVTYQGLLAVNISPNSRPLSMAIPFLWPFNDSPLINTRVPMAWDNGLNGWSTNNWSDGLGGNTSLTVKLTSYQVAGSAPAVPGSVAMGEIADLTGTQQIPLTQPCTGQPSCFTASFASFPPETRQLNDLIPLISLGLFDGTPDPNSPVVKRFDVSFSYAFGDQSAGAKRTDLIAFTVSEVPVPAAVWLFVSALGALRFFRKRNIA